MAGNSEVLREFLVSLGWKIDAGGQRKAAKAIADFSASAIELGTVMAATATAVVAGIAKIAEGMEKLYFASQRTKASVENIQALGFAAGQMGSTADAAQASLENLARFMRNNPGGEGIIKGLGVQTHDANGELRDTTDLLQDLGKRFAQMPYYRANAYAQALGIDEKTLMALREGLGQFGSEYKAMLAAAGLDSTKAAKASHEWMNQIRGVGAAIQILSMKVAQQALPVLQNFTEKLRAAMIAHMPFISDVITKTIEMIGRVITRIFQLGEDAVTAWDRLGESSKTLVKALAAIGVAWLALNSGFLLSPIGIILELGAAILLLYDDYKTWKEGGKSLIDWSKWEPEITAAAKAIHWLTDSIEELLSGFNRLNVKIDLSNLTKTLDAVSSAIQGKWKPVWRFLVGDAAAAQLNADAKSTREDLRKLKNGDFAGLARGIRNNNPGNIEFGSFARKEGATGVEDKGRFAVFQTAEDGLKALADLLRNYASKGIDSVKAIISKYAPAGENNTSAYVGTVAKRLGVSEDAHLNLSDPTVLANMMDSIARVEVGNKNPYSKEQFLAAAQRSVDGSGTSGQPLTIHQTNTTTINGVSDPQRAGKEAGSAQADVNQRLIRNLQAHAF